MVRYQQNPDVACQVFADEAVLIAARSSQMYSLNPTATIIWQALAQPRTATQVADAVSAVFEVDAARALADVSGFLADFADRDLIQTIAL